MKKADQKSNNTMPVNEIKRHMTALSEDFIRILSVTFRIKL